MNETNETNEVSKAADEAASSKKAILAAVHLAMAQEQLEEAQEESKLVVSRTSKHAGGKMRPPGWRQAKRAKRKHTKLARRKGRKGRKGR